VNAEIKPFEFSALVRKSAEIVAKQNRRYRVRRACEFNISLDNAGVSLNKQRPDVVLDAETYHAEEVQRAIASGHIELSEILEMRIDEEGRSSWVSTEAPDSAEANSATLAADGQPCVFWEGPIFDAGGYANMNRQYCFHLNELGTHVKPSLVSTLMDVEPDVRQKLVDMSHNLIPAQSPKVYATNIPNRHIGRCVSYTMMETENRIHDQLVQHLLAADEIWVPCEWNRQVFANSGVNREIRVMPLGVDEEEYHPAKPSAVFSSGTKGFTFLSVFNWNWRKAPDVLMKAYIRAFTSKDDVSLVMVSRYVGQTSMSGQIYKDIKSWTARERESDRPHVMLVDEVIPTFLMPRLYNSADAFVLFSRGEGWGLPSVEAAASGTPLLTSFHGGHEMFLDDSTAMLLTPDKVTPVHESVKWISPFYHDMEFADYSDKAIDRAAEMMREMYENRDACVDRAGRCRQKIIDNFTWRHAAERVAARLKHIQP
jgi:glycosyltransferase involved in cell wall biosynthesis